MYLNSNNFLRWEGLFNKAPFTLSANSFTEIFFANVDSITFDPLTDLSATALLGVNYKSFKIKHIYEFGGGEVELSKPAFYDGQFLTIYRPLDLSITLLVLDYSFEDNSGNEYLGSLISATLEVVISTVTVKWVAYPASSLCAIDLFGNNNGLIQWSQLKLVNAITLADIIPLTLKPNIISDPDYVPPVTNLITCPVTTGGVYSSLIIGNFSQKTANGLGNYIVITSITLACTACGSGGTPVLLTLSCNITPNNTQRFNVPSLSWDTGISIQYTLFGNMATVPFPVGWRSQLSGVVDNFPTGGFHQVDNSGLYGNFAINVPFPNGITIFCS